MNVYKKLYSSTNISYNHHHPLPVVSSIFLYYALVLLSIRDCTKQFFSLLLSSFQIGILKYNDENALHTILTFISIQGHKEREKVRKICRPVSYSSSSSCLLTKKQAKIRNIFNIQKYSTKQRGTNEERVKYMYNNNNNVNRITLFADKPFPCSLALD